MQTTQLFRPIKLLGTLAFAAWLAACSSTVKLDDVKVEDKTGFAVAPQPQVLPPVATKLPGDQGQADGVGTRNVAGATIAAQGAAGVGPNVAKIIYFDYDSFAIKPEFQSAMEAHAKFLALNKTSKMAIEGHTDERGGREYNLALGQKRSEAVRRALSLLGVAEAQIEAVSFGKEKPAATGADEASLARNRRAEINYK
jgi:peptidoglycan-associated lipoprotein